MQSARVKFYWATLALAWSAGCGQGVSTPGTGSSEQKATTPATPVTTSAVPPRPVAPAGSPPAVPAASAPAVAPNALPAPLQPAVQQPSPVAAPSAAARSAAAPRIALSTGVALPQTLPDGTAILCSMDYRWASGDAHAGTEYLWVVKLGSGKQVTGQANVAKSHGTIQMVLRGVRPEDGPFQGAVFVKQGNAGAAPTQISDFIDLR